MTANASGHLQMSNGECSRSTARPKALSNGSNSQPSCCSRKKASATALYATRRALEHRRPRRRRGVRAGALLQKPPFSLRNVALDVQANPDRISVAGNVGIPELDSQDLAVEATGNFAKRVLNIAPRTSRSTTVAAKMHAKGTVTFEATRRRSTSRPAGRTGSGRYTAKPSSRARRAKERCADRCRTTSRRRRSMARICRRHKARPRRALEGRAHGRASTTSRRSTAR